MIFFPSSSFRYYFFCLCLLAGISSCTKNFVLSGLDDKLPENPQPVLSPYDSFHIDNVRWLHSVMKEREFKDLTFDTFRLVWTEGGDKKLEIINITSDPNLALYVIRCERTKKCFLYAKNWDNPYGKGGQRIFQARPL